MKLRLLAFVICIYACGFAGVWLSQIDATCLDENGKPLVKATVKFSDSSTGRKFSATTDAKGKFLYGAAQPGTYDVTIERGGVKVIEFQHLGVPWSSQPLLMTVNLATRSIAFNRQTKQAESFGAEEPVGTPAASSIGEDPQSGALRKAVEDATAREDAGDWNGAIEILKQSTETAGKTSDVIWARLGSAYCQAATNTGSPSAARLAR